MNDWVLLALMAAAFGIVVLSAERNRRRGHEFFFGLNTGVALMIGVQLLLCLVGAFYAR